MSDYADLIARLERASGPDRELDCAIYRKKDRTIETIWPYWTPEERMDFTPRYTDSIDAALQLVPEGMAVLMAIGHGTKATVSIGPLGDYETRWIGDGNAPTLALALCIAALRARAYQESQKP